MAKAYHGRRRATSGPTPRPSVRVDTQWLRGSSSLEIVAANSRPGPRSLTMAERRRVERAEMVARIAPSGRPVEAPGSPMQPIRALGLTRTLLRLPQLRPSRQLLRVTLG